MKKHHQLLLSIALSLMAVRAVQAQVPDDVPSDKILPSATFNAASLRQVLLDASRQVGVRFMFDPAVENKTISGSFAALSGRDFFDAIAKASNVTFERVAPQTYYVQATTSQDATTHGEDTPAVQPVLAVAQPLPNQQTHHAVTSASPTAKYVVLKAGVEHHERLEPVDKELRIGQRVSMSRLKALTPNNHWSRVPNWTAGYWEALSQTAYYHYLYKEKEKILETSTFMNKSLGQIAWQKDRLGNMWHYDHINYFSAVEGENDYSVDFVKSEDITEVADDHFVLCFVSIRADVDKATLRVKHVYQLEGVNVYTSPEPGVIRCKASMKDFDENGMPKQLQKGIVYDRKIGEFLPINSYKGRNMRALFEEYLTSQGLFDLIPN